MSNHERSGLSSHILDFGETAQRLLANPGKPLVRAVAGSNSSSYMQLSWQKQPHISPREIAPFCMADGESKVLNWIPRTWRTAAIIATRTAEFCELESAAVGTDSQDAVAYISQNSVRVGISQEQEQFIAPLGEDDNRVAVGMRLSKRPLLATIGLWLPEEKVFLAPRSISVVEDRIPTDQISAEYPQIKLV